MLLIKILCQKQNDKKRLNYKREKLIYHVNINGSKDEMVKISVNLRTFQSMEYY